VLWEARVSTGPAQYFFHSDPYLAADAVVADADSANGAAIHAFDIATGKERWRYDIGRGANGPLAGLGRRVFVATLERGLIALAADSGAPIWNRELKTPGFEGPAARDGRVFVGTVDGFLAAVDAETGRDVWRIPIGSAATTTPLATDAAVYAGTDAGVLWRVDPRTGRSLASMKLDEALKPRSVPVTSGDALLVLLTDAGASYKSLVSVDPALSRVHWRVDAAKDWSTSRAFVWRGVAVLGTDAGDVLAYNVADGSPAWSMHVTGSVRAIGGANDVLFVSTRQGSLYAFRR
jgi:outer membrane protein assembly factor BamB